MPSSRLGRSPFSSCERAVCPSPPLCAAELSPRLARSHGEGPPLSAATGCVTLQPPPLPQFDFMGLPIHWSSRHLNFAVTSPFLDSAAALYGRGQQTAQLPRPPRPQPPALLSTLGEPSLYVTTTRCGLAAEGRSRVFMVVYNSTPLSTGIHGGQRRRLNPDTCKTSRTPTPQQIASCFYLCFTVSKNNQNRLLQCSALPLNGILPAPNFKTRNLLFTLYYFTNIKHLRIVKVFAYQSVL
ncbi:hypothetical protein FOCC_FOCC001349 [Frankliniella occidentalis]|nr:hypothetical protein FOCC_FOCC001349 [Frankliniella occidentalis]